MKAFAAFLVTVPMSGCVIHWPPGPDNADGTRRGAQTVVVCIFANCRDIVKPPEKQETPTPSPNALLGENAPNSQASRLSSGARAKGIGSHSP